LLTPCGLTELYDLEKDPGEIDNIARENQKLVNKLKKKSEHLAGSHIDNKVNSNEETIQYQDEEQIEDQLRALGYK
jgi:hypothetical protein